MVERYVRPTVAGWLTPTLLAPWMASYATVTALVLFHLDGIFGRVLGWTFGMVVASIWSFVYCAILVLVDLALLTMKVRTLPSGRRGWGSTLCSPIIVFVTYASVPPYKFYPAGGWAVAAAILFPMLVVAIVSRMVAGTKTLAR